MSAAPSLAPDSLALALVLAARACQGVREKRSLNATLDDAFNTADGRQATRETRAAAQDLAFYSMRWRARSDGLLKRLSSRAPDPAVVAELLVIALGLLEASERPDAPHYASHTLVDQSVRAAAHLAPQAAARVLSGFVNAVLRRALKRPPEIFQPVAQGSVDRELEIFNYPRWWVDAVRRAYPEQYADILQSGQSQAPLSLRVNTRRLQPLDAIELLERSGIKAHALGVSGLRLEKACRVDLIPGFAEGLFSVQDEAAQRAAALLDLAAGQRVLDACAAPGGKSGHILELADVDLTALDIDATRLKRVADNLTRLGLQGNLLQGDATDPAAWWDGQPFQRILADLPCSASGIVRRHPDIRWLRRQSDIVSLSHRQQHMLDALWRLLAPNGKLLLVTCSIFPQEGVSLANQFLSRHQDARRLAAPGQLLPEATEHVDHDGLFYSLLEKAA